MVRQQDRTAKIIEKASETIISMRWVFLTVISLVAIAASFGLFHLKTSTSLQNLFLKDDPVIVEQDKFNDIFGNSDFIGVLVESEDMFSSESLLLLEELTGDLMDRVPWIADASSILKMSQTPHQSMSDEEREEFRSSLDSRNSVKSVLYSEDYTQAWILCSLRSYPVQDKAKGALGPSYIVGREVMEIINEYQDRGVEVRATGVPVLEYRKSNELTADLIKVVIFAAIAAVLLIVLLTRSLACTVGSLLVTAMTILSVFGTLGWMGKTVDMTFMLVPILLTIAVSIGYSIHVFNFFRRHLIETGLRKDSIIKALSDSGWPVFFTALTTIFALFSFIVVPIGPIQWVGLTSSVSIVVVFVLTMLFLAPVLSLGSDRPGRDTKTYFKGTEAFLERLGAFVMGRRKTFIILSALAVLTGFWGLSKVEVDIKAMEMMGMKMPHIQDQSYISQSPIGVNFSYSIALAFPEEDEALNPEILGKVDELTDFIYKTPYIKRVTSINDIIKEVNRLRHRDDPEYYAIPGKASLVRGIVSYTRRLSGDSVKLLLNDENRVLRVMVEINDVSTSAMVDHIDEVKAEIDRLFPPSEFAGMEHLMAGSVIQMSEMNQHITKGLVRSVVLALIVISIMMMIVFKSFKLGLISMIPNISPVIIAGGVMGFMGESLEFVTMTIAPMIMGLAVDDTIHFINHVRVEFNRNRSYDLAIQNSFIKVGKAMTQATLILCVTFLMFTTSIAHSMVNMGIYINIGMLTALIADFTITPILIKISKPFGKES